MFREFAPPMVAYGTHAIWHFHLGRNGDYHDQLYQISPQTTDPAKDIVPFLKEVAAIYAAGGKAGISQLKVPGYDTTSLEGWSIPEPSFAGIMRTLWPDLCTSPVPRRLRGRTEMTIAYRWDVWPDDSVGCTASFCRYGADGRIVEVHNVARTSLDELQEALAISDALANLTKNL